VIGLKEGRVVYQGSKQDIQRITDAQFKSIYGEEAERMGGIVGELTTEGEGAA